MNVNCVIGIDPGASGGIAVYIPGRLTKTLKMPKDPKDFRAFISYYRENFQPIVFIEKLSVRPDDVSVSNDRAAMGKMYRIQKMMANFEQMKAIMEVEGVPFVLTHPMTWQTKLTIRERGWHEEKAERKNRYKERAAALYPGVKITLWNADALLLMHFGRWALKNDLEWVKANLPSEERKELFP